jgi:hypothetical protein
MSSLFSFPNPVNDKAARVVAAGALTMAADVLLGVLMVAASLEAFAGFCVGCRVFAGLMRMGVIPDTVCEECANIALRADRQAGAA